MPRPMARAASGGPPTGPDLAPDDAVAKEIRVFGFGGWVRQRRRAEAEAYLVRAGGGTPPCSAVSSSRGLLTRPRRPFWSSASRPGQRPRGTITSADLARYIVAGLGLIDDGRAPEHCGWHVAYGGVGAGCAGADPDPARRRTAADDSPIRTRLVPIHLDDVAFRYARARWSWTG